MMKIDIISRVNKIKVLNQKGMALIATLIFVFVLVTFGIALLTMTNNESKLSTLQKESTRAFYVAETGIEKALWYINVSPDNTEGLDWRTTQDNPYYDGSSEEYFNVWVTTDGTDSDGKANKIKFISNGIVNKGGEFNKGNRSIEVKLIKGIAQNNSLAYNYAIFTDDYMRINGNIYVNGDVHSNGDIDVSGGSFDLVNGDATAAGTVSGYPSGISGAGKQEVPVIVFDTYKSIAKGEIEPEIGGVYYGDGTSKIFSTNQTLTGINFVDGDIIIKPPLDKLIIKDGAIIATGKITVEGNPDIEIIHSEGYDNPLAIIAQGDITLGGNVHGEGVIQTNGTFTLNGTINIERGCIVAEDGIFNGGGGDMNVVYDNGLQDDIVVGTGIEIWKKASWQEIYL
jgi:hypothetical protein